MGTNAPKLKQGGSHYGAVTFKSALPSPLDRVASTCLGPSHYRGRIGVRSASSVVAALYGLSNDFVAVGKVRLSLIVRATPKSRMQAAPERTGHNCLEVELWDRLR